MAANTRDIRRRIKSVKNTAQITKAMQMVAASKMRRAQAAALAGRPYAGLLNRVLASLGAGDRRRGFARAAEQRAEGKELVLIISTDKGLCGALNTNLLREAAQFAPENTVFVAAGRKAMQFLVRGKRQVLADFELKDNFTFLESKAISKFCVEKFLSGEVNRVTVLYTRLRQHADAGAARPHRAAGDQPRGDHRCAGAAWRRRVEPTGLPAGEVGAMSIIFEPSAPSVLSVILPHYVHFQVYQMALDARASEHSARMVAMKNATDNAKQIIKDLTLEYNKVRQASITTEILEIATAQMALG